MSNKVLSQEEIDELLVAITEIPPIRTENDGEKKIKICDFLRPDILSKEQLYRMETIMEVYAARLTDFFQREYGLDTAIQFDGIDQLKLCALGKIYMLYGRFAVKITQMM